MGSVLPGTTSLPSGRSTDGRARSTTGPRDGSHFARGGVCSQGSSSARSAITLTRSPASSRFPSLMVGLTTSAGFLRRPRLPMVDLVRRQPTRYGGRADTALAVVLDCADLDRATDFWCAALGYVTLPKEAGSGPYHVLLPADGSGIELLLQQVTDEPLRNNGWTWHVLRDPDRNEFCVLRPPDKYRDGLTRSGAVNDPVNDSSLTKEALL